MKKLYIQVILSGIFMLNPLFLHGMSDAEQLWNEIGDKLVQGEYPSDELLADFNQKLKEGNEQLINRPYGEEGDSKTLLFRAVTILLNTWQFKIFDGTLDTLPWVNKHLNRVVDMLYGYGARLTESEKELLCWRYGRLNSEIKKMDDDFVSTEFVVLAQLLNKIGINVNSHFEKPIFEESNSHEPIGKPIID